MGLIVQLCESPITLVAVFTIFTNLLIFHQGYLQLQHMKNLAEEVGVQEHQLSKRGHQPIYWSGSPQQPQNRGSSITESFRSLASTDEDSTASTTSTTEATAAPTSTTSLPTSTTESGNHRGALGTKNLFIRYGKHTCPSNTQAGALSLFGSYGFVAGLKDPGVLTSSNLMCLPARPRISGTTLTHESVSTSKSVVPVIFKTEQLISASVEAKDGVLKCVMCLSSRSVVVMFPGVNTCYDGWLFEYKGWLISSHKENPRDSVDLTCVDSNVDVYPTAIYSKRNHIVVTLAHMGTCGIDEVCDSYSANQLIPCVVCSL